MKEAFFTLEKYNAMEINDEFNFDIKNKRAARHRTSLLNVYLKPKRFVVRTTKFAEHGTVLRVE